MGGRALTPPSRHRLGRPLPYQLADSRQAHLSTPQLTLKLLSYDVMRYYPAFRRAIPHQEVDSYLVLTRLPLTSNQQSAFSRQINDD